MNRALSILSDAELPVLVRVSVFHFMFAYIHPFYDGNGRTNRFISSYALSHSFNPIVEYRLSYSVKERIDKYCKGFSVCEHPLSRGDLTPVRHLVFRVDCRCDGQHARLPAGKAKRPGGCC